MKKFSGIFIIVLLVAVGIIANVMLFTVKETDQAIVLRFGDPVRIESNAGLKMKQLPWESIVYIDKRNLGYDIANGRELEIIAANEERLIIDAFVRYEIVDPLMYYESFKQGSGSWQIIRGVGDRRISALLETALRRSLGEVNITEIITSRRAELMQTIQEQMEIEARRFGVDIVDVKIRRADFPEQNAQRVYERMSSERRQQAEKIRAEGEEEAKKIRAEAEKQRVTILSEAEETAQKTRGRADAQRNAIFAEAYNRDPEFFAFYRSLLAYEQSLQNGEGETTIILSPDSEFFRYFKSMDGNN